jgi:hypothetical protein
MLGARGNLLGVPAVYVVAWVLKISVRKLETQVNETIHSVI